MSWTEVVAAIGGTIGAGGGVAGVVLGVHAQRRANRIAGDQLDVSVRATEISEAQHRLESRMTEIAEEQRRLAEEQHRLVHDVRHDELAPVPPPSITAVRRKAEGLEHELLEGKVTVARDYRVTVEAIVGSNSRRRLALDLLRANQVNTFEIESWPKSREAPQTEALIFRFWPATDGLDAAPGWSCPCGRPVEYGDGTGRGHWEWGAVPIAYEQQVPFAFYGN